MSMRIFVMAAALAGLSSQLPIQETLAQDKVAQETVESLKLKLEQLEAKLSLADKTIELLQKQCELLEKENSQLKRMEGGKETNGKLDTGASNSANTDDADLFRVGVVWVGEAKINGGATARWAISVSERNGKELTGGIIAQAADGKKVEFPVAGSAPSGGNGLVVLETPLIGRAKIFMRGRLQNGEVALALSGTGRLGEKLAGAATLRPKN